MATTRKNPREILEVDPSYCFGRAAICDRLKKIPFNEGAALLFGGILSRKTTVLRRVENDLLSENEADNAIRVVPVFLDLRSEAMLDPAHLFGSLLHRSLSACQRFFGSN